jgi:4a-hydroxytetrahydrobiopterin dehydratase
MDDDVVTRDDASAALEKTGWRVLLNTIATAVPTTSFAQSAEVAEALAHVAGADDRLRMDLRSNRVELTIETRSRRTTFAASDVALARQLTAAIGELGLTTTAQPEGRPVQALEIAIDALDIPRIRPFWKAVMGYTDEPGGDGPADAVVDPLRQNPTIWFQQMDAPRPQRNRIHFDIVVAHDEADRRREAALAAGGTLVSAAYARAFWILADAEGNEICICTCQDRDRD